MNGQTFNGYENRGPAAPPQSSTLVEFNSEIAIATKQVAELREQARSIADSVFGVASQPGISGTVQANFGSNSVSVAPPKASAVRSSLSELHNVIAQLRTEVERLSCI